MKIKFQKLHKDAQIPTRGTEEAAGMDLYALEDTWIPECVVDNTRDWTIDIGQRRVSTGIACEIPIGFFGKVEARSGLSFNNGIETGAGVVDSDFRGEVGIKVYNFTNKPYKVTKGQRIAQMVIQPYLVCEAIEAEIDTDTERGTNGFGSTGK